MPKLILDTSSVPILEMTMATKKIVQEVCSCDFCESDGWCYTKCLDCGKDVCYKCKGEVGVEYYHSVTCSGSGDGFYCHACDVKSKTVVHAGYVTIARLREQWKAMYENYRKSAAEAEAYLKRAQKAQEQLKNEDY